MVQISFAQAFGEFDALFERDAFDGDEGDHVGRADARMRALVFCEVDQRDGLFHGAEGGVGDGGGRTDESEYAAIVVGIGFAVEQHHFGHGEDRLHDGVDLGGSRPSLKLGTHSTSCLGIYSPNVATAFNAETGKG